MSYGWSMLPLSILEKGRGLLEVEGEERKFTWFAVVSTTSLFNSLSTASHWQCSTNWLKQNKGTSNKNNHRALMIYIEYMLEVSESTKLTTHPDPWRAAPSALIFCINASKEPKFVSIAHPRASFGGSPPPSCTRCKVSGKRTIKYRMVSM